MSVPLEPGAVVLWTFTPKLPGDWAGAGRGPRGEPVALFGLENVGLVQAPLLPRLAEALAPVPIGSRVTVSYRGHTARDAQDFTVEIHDEEVAEAVHTQTAPDW